MSKILITFLSPIFDNNKNNLVCYYDSLAKELIQNGNNVKLANMINCNTNISNDALSEITHFNPDLILAFNNQITEDIIKSTNCKIILFEADLVVFFNNLDLLKKYLDRYYMVTFYDEYIKSYEKLGFANANIIKLHPATAVQREIKEQDKNISFIGSMFSGNYDDDKYSKNETRHNIYRALTFFWKHKNFDYTYILKKFVKDIEFTVFDEYAIFDSRVYILSSILDLGLSLYGVRFNELSKINNPLFLVFDQEPKYSLQHNQDIYNTSKINLSISHPQTKGYSFPWRVYDIMASGGMLISSWSSQLNRYTRGYVQIPMYHSPYDARDLCKKYLQDEKLRLEIIEASNHFIEKNGRWKSNFNIIEKITGVKLINNNTEFLDFSCIDPIIQNTSFNNNEKDVIDPEKKKHRWIKSLFYRFMHSFINFPVLRSVFSNKYKSKIYRSVGKYCNHPKK